MAAMAKRVDVSDKGKYRKVDVDAIDEDQYRDEETEDSGQEQQVNQRAQEVRQLLSKGQVRDAVARALQAPPLGSKNQAVKVTAVHGAWALRGRVGSAWRHAHATASRSPHGPRPRPASATGQEHRGCRGRADVGQGSRDWQHCAVAGRRHSGRADEVPVRGHGIAREVQRDQPARVARGGTRRARRRRTARSATSRTSWLTTCAGSVVDAVACTGRERGRHGVHCARAYGQEDGLSADTRRVDPMFSTFFVRRCILALYCLLILAIGRGALGWLSRL